VLRLDGLSVGRNSIHGPGVCAARYTRLVITPASTWHW